MTDEELLDAAVTYCQMRGSTNVNEYVMVFARMRAHSRATAECVRKGLDPMAFRDLLHGSDTNFAHEFHNRDDGTWLALGRRLVRERFGAKTV